VVCAWLNVGELPRFDNQPQHLAALFLHRMSNVKGRVAQIGWRLIFPVHKRVVIC
jgi:hypothetical protein